MKLKEHTRIVLTQDLPADSLKKGDVGTIVHVHNSGSGYEVEFMTLSGITAAIATVLPSQLRPVAKRDITHAREIPTI